MRIRSIKPEFWRSEDITSLDWEVRLLFIGLWSYVDDNGVGRDIEKLIVADLFPLEDDPRETLATVSRGLRDLFGRGLIVRYSVGGAPLLHITSWEKHQRIDKPNRARYEPPTCTNAVIRDTLATPSRGSSETPAPGAGDLGNRGTGDLGSKGAMELPPTADVGEPPSRALAIVSSEPTAQTLTAEWIDHCDRRPPGNVIGQISKHLKTMLDEGIEPDRLRAALALWNSKGLHPSTLPSVVHEVGNKRATPKRNDIDWDSALQQARAIDAGGQR